MRYVFSHLGDLKSTLRIIHTRQILEEQNFIVVSSAEFLGAHTYNLGGHKAMEGHPDAIDLKMAKEFAQAAYKRFTGEDDGVLG